MIQDSTFIPQVVIPPQYLGWMKEQPEKALSAETVRLEQLGLRYLVPLSDPEMGHLLTNTVSRYLTRDFHRVQGPLFDELRTSTDEILGSDSSVWHRVRLFDAVQTIQQRVINRIMVGLPLCRDESCLTSWRKFLRCLAIMGTILGAIVPWFLRPFFGPILRLPVEYLRRKSLFYLTPIFTERWKQIEEQKEHSLPADFPDDFVTWCIQATQTTNLKLQHDAASLASEFQFFVSQSDTELYQLSSFSSTKYRLAVMAKEGHKSVNEPTVNCIL